MCSTTLEAPAGASTVRRRRGCNQGCLNNIAKHFCETSDKHETACGKDQSTVLSVKPSGCCDKPATSALNTVKSKSCCVDEKKESGCRNEREAVSGCCDKPKVVKDHNLDVVSSCETTEDGAKDTNATACCTSTESVMVREACCKSETRDSPAATDYYSDSSEAKKKTIKCCSPPDETEKSAQSSYWNDTASEDALLCSSTCCDATDKEPAADAASSCSRHLEAAFKRFESLILLGQCLCRKMIEEFNFCCCCGQTSPHLSCTQQGNLAVKTSQRSSATCEDDCCTSPKTDKGQARCEDTGRASGKTARQSSVGGKDACCASPKADKGRTHCGKEIGRASEKTARQSSVGGKDACCATEKTPAVSDLAAITPIPDGLIDIDIEKAREKNHVALKVSGMTCTSCSKKLLNVLRDIPGISHPHVTFVSDTAAFDFDPTKGSIDDVLPLIEKRTGFKLSRVTAAFHELDVLLDAAEAQAYEWAEIGGLVSFDKLKGNNKYRITYDPQVAGARSLVPAGARLAPPELDAANFEGRKRLIKMAWATLISAIFTIPVVVLSWSDNPIPQQTRQIISLVLATVVQAIAVPEFYVGAIKSLVFSRVMEMDMLVVISVTAAYGYSIIAFGLAEAGIELKQEAFFETSSLLITLVLVGRLMATIARMRAISAVSMSSLQSNTALLLHADGQTEEIDARLLQFEDVIRVAAHTSIVTDGIITTGSSTVDEAMLTGESNPVTKVKGDTVVAGTINGSGTLDVRITRLFNANSISDIKTLVNDALGAKPKIQDLADKVASWFIPTVVAISLVTCGIWIAIALTIRDENGGGAVGTAMTYGIAVLAISCPCALGLAVPMVLVIAGGAAARSGVIIKGVDALERGHKATDVLFDKTGTLTLGGLAVVHEHIRPSLSISEDAAVGLAKGLVTGNSHPVSSAIGRHLENRSAPSADLEGVESIPGSGIQGRWKGCLVQAGNPSWLDMTNDSAVVEILEQGLTAFCVSVDGEFVLAYGLRSTIREEANAVVSALHRRNLHCHVISGDNEKAVRDVAAAVGIDPGNVMAHCTPMQKKEYVEQLQSDGRVVLFCGDGTNDAIAVAQANVGMQIGTASDVTKGVCDVTLLGGLDGIPIFLDISKRSFNRIAFNFVWSVVYNVFAILLASGALVKFRIPPAYAGLGEIVSVGPVVLAAISLIWASRW